MRRRVRIRLPPPPRTLLPAGLLHALPNCASVQRLSAAVSEVLRLWLRAGARFPRLSTARLRLLETVSRRRMQRPVRERRRPVRKHSARVRCLPGTRVATHNPTAIAPSKKSIFSRRTELLQQGDSTQGSRQIAAPLMDFADAAPATSTIDQCRPSTGLRHKGVRSPQGQEAGTAQRQLMTRGDTAEAGLQINDAINRDRVVASHWDRGP